MWKVRLVPNRHTAAAGRLGLSSARPANSSPGKPGLPARKLLLIGCARPAAGVGEAAAVGTAEWEEATGAGTTDPGLVWR